MPKVRRLLAEWLCPELRHEAGEDPLTGALNKRADDVATTRAVAERSSHVSLLRLRADLDNFKTLNDEHGHQAGDRALCAVYRALVEATRDVDVISLARPGGDEFALTLRVSEDAHPALIRDRIEDAVNRALALVVRREAWHVPVGISIGYARLQGATTAQRLDAAADEATQQRKIARGLSRPRHSPDPARAQRFIMSDPAAVDQHGTTRGEDDRAR